jgi:hypothetical protein
MAKFDALAHSKFAMVKNCECPQLVRTGSVHRPSSFSDNADNPTRALPNVHRQHVAGAEHGRRYIMRLFPKQVSSLCSVVGGMVTKMGVTEILWTLSLGFAVSFAIHPKKHSSVVGAHLVCLRAHIHSTSSVADCTVH